LHFDKPAPPLPPERGEACSGEELRRISRENLVADELLAAYITLAHIPLEVLAVGERPAEERRRYAMMGTLMVASEAIGGTGEPAEAGPSGSGGTEDNGYSHGSRRQHLRVLCAAHREFFLAYRRH
jgi:hypothetical protein